MYLLLCTRGYVLYTGFDTYLCMVCVLVVRAWCVCACLSGWVYVVSVHVLWHLREPMMLTYTLGEAGPDRSWALWRKRASSPTSMPRPPVSASPFSLPLGALASFCLSHWQLPAPHHGRDWACGSLSLPHLPLTPALELLTKVAGSGWGKWARKKLRRQGRSRESIRGSQEVW